MADDEPEIPLGLMLQAFAGIDPTGQSFTDDKGGVWTCTKVERFKPGLYRGREIKVHAEGRLRGRPLSGECERVDADLEDASLESVPLAPSSSAETPDG